MPLLALRKFRSHISKKYFYTCGIKIASHPYYILCISLFIICFISYSVFIDYITTPHSLSPPLIDAHLWQFSSHLQQQQQQVSESESFIAQQIRVVSLEHTVSKQLLRETLAIYQSLTVSNQLKTICATTQQRQCLVHSILSLWDYSQQKIDTDTDIIATINQHGVSKTTGLSLHPYTTLGNVSLDSHGSLLSADSIILTFILKNTSKTQDTWDQLWQRSVSSKTTFKLDIEPCWIQYKVIKTDKRLCVTFTMHIHAKHIYLAEAIDSITHHFFGSYLEWYRPVLPCQASIHYKFKADQINFWFGYHYFVSIIRMLHYNRGH
jgi:hypothetical protein